MKSGALVMRRTMDEMSPDRRRHDASAPILASRRAMSNKAVVTFNVNASLGSPDQN